MFFGKTFREKEIERKGEQYDRYVAKAEREIRRLRTKCIQDLQRGRIEGVQHMLTGYAPGCPGPAFQ